MDSLQKICYLTNGSEYSPHRKNIGNCQEILKYILVATQNKTVCKCDYITKTNIRFQKYNTAKIYYINKNKLKKPHRN